MRYGTLLGGTWTRGVKVEQLNQNIGKAFYHLLTTLGDEVVKSNMFDEATKKELFKFVVDSYDELSEADKEIYNTAGLQGVKSGLDMLNYLTKIKEKSNGA